MWPKRVERYIALYLPFWSTGILERGWCTHPHHSPYFLYAGGDTEQHIVRLCRCAEDSGARAGMNVTMGKALVPYAQALPFDDYKDFRSLYKVALWCTRFSPLVALDSELMKAFRARSLHRLPPHYTGIFIDITGTERLHGSEQALASSLVQRFGRRNMQARIAIAPTIGAAWALSRFSERHISIVTEHADLAAALFPLTVQSLRLQDETIVAFKQLGIHCIEQATRLPRSQVLRRFPDVLLRLDQALGRRSETLNFIHPQEPFRASMQLEVPITTQEPLFRIVFHLLQRVTTQLVARGHRARAFLVELVKFDQDRIPCIIRKEFTLFASTNSSTHVHALLQPFLESIYAPHGICAVHVRAHVQAGEDSQGDIPASDLMNHLVTRLGRTNVVRASFAASHLPERSFSYHAITEPVAESSATEVPLSNRPSYLLAEPEPITAIALLPDRAPSWVQWRGKKLPVKNGQGPERIGDEWWHYTVRLGEEPSARDYFKLEDESGRWLWIFRDQHSMRWHIHGLWL